MIIWWTLGTVPTSNLTVTVTFGTGVSIPLVTIGSFPGGSCLAGSTGNIPLISSLTGPTLIRGSEVCTSAAFTEFAMIDLPATAPGAALTAVGAGKSIMANSVKAAEVHTSDPLIRVGPVRDDISGMLPVLPARQLPPGNDPIVTSGIETPVPKVTVTVKLLVGTVPKVHQIIIILVGVVGSRFTVPPTVT
jgi:hypothetical protein